MSKRLQFIIGLQWVTFSLTQLSHSVIFIRKKRLALHRYTFTE